MKEYSICLYILKIITIFTIWNFVKTRKCILYFLRCVNETKLDTKRINWFRCFQFDLNLFIPFPNYVLSWLSLRNIWWEFRFAHFYHIFQLFQRQIKSYTQRNFFRIECCSILEKVSYIFTKKKNLLTLIRKYFDLCYLSNLYVYHFVETLDNH